MSYLDKVTVGSTTYDIQDSKAQADVADLKSATAYDLEKIVGITDLLLTATWTQDKYIDASGTEQTGNRFMASGYIPVKETEYILYWQRISQTSYIRIHGYNSSKVWQEQITYINTATVGEYTLTVNVPSGISYIRISAAKPAEMILHAMTDSKWTLTEALDTVKYRGTLTAHDDTHSLKYPGLYFAYGNDQPANSPINGSPYRLLVVKSSSENVHTAEFQLAVGATGIYFQSYSAGVGAWYNWQKISADTKLIEYTDIKSLGLHTVPESVGVLNVIRRARQMTDIKWTPAVDIPRAFMLSGDSYNDAHVDGFFGEFEAGKEYTGIPYSDAHDIGALYSIESFASSVGNSQSAMALESPGSDISNPCYYGAVCTNLTSYAINLPQVASNYWGDIPGMSTVGSLDTLDIGLLKLADILKVNGHCALITDIVVNSSGDVTAIEISEATRYGNENLGNLSGKDGGKCRRVMFSPVGLKKWFAGFTVLRYSYLDSVPYAPNPYSPMDDEGIPIAYTNMPVVPYLGDKSSYSNVGDRKVKLLIQNTGNVFTNLAVKKDGSAWNENGTTDMYDITGLSEITITCDSGFAVYTAQLVQMNNGTAKMYSTSCSWAIRPDINPTVSVSSGQASFSYTVKGDVYKPWFVTFGSTTSDTDAQIVNGHVYKVFDIYTVTDNGNGTYTYTFSVDYPSGNPGYYRLGIQSDHYGGGSKANAI